MWSINTTPVGIKEEHASEHSKIDFTPIKADYEIATAAVKERLELAARKCRITVRYAEPEQRTDVDTPSANPDGLGAEWKGAVEQGGARNEESWPSVDCFCSSVGPVSFRTASSTDPPTPASGLTIPARM